MNKNSNDIVYLQKIIQGFDISECQFIAVWLSDHIKTLEIDRELFKINIQQLELSARTFNLLKENKINSIGELLTRSSDWDKIRMLKGAGEKVLEEIKQTITLVRTGKFNT
jgi:DNA-directed RNA polymerase alpha subunit